MKSLQQQLFNDQLIWKTIWCKKLVNFFLSRTKLWCKQPGKIMVHGPFNWCFCLSFSHRCIFQWTYKVCFKKWFKLSWIIISRAKETRTAAAAYPVHHISGIEVGVVSIVWQTNVLWRSVYALSYIVPETWVSHNTTYETMSYFACIVRPVWSNLKLRSTGNSKRRI